jgi:2-polyprenyl-3-methyl-5-hydroxy-6-metoxy-1,4-benzoquinol methylase
VSAIPFDPSSAIAVDLPDAEGNWKTVSVVVASQADALIDHYVSSQDKNSHETGTPFGAFLWPSTFGFLRHWVAQKKHVPPKVLELGCGVGVLGSCFAAWGADVTCTDCCRK